MPHGEGGNQRSLLPRWAWVALLTLIVALGAITFVFGAVNERWSSATWTGLATLAVTVVVTRALRRHNTGTQRGDRQQVGSGEAPSWDDPALKRGAAIVVLICVLIGMFGAATLWWGTANSSTSYDRSLAFVGGPILMLLGFGVAARIAYRWWRGAHERDRQKCRSRAD